MMGMGGLSTIPKVPHGGAEDPLEGDFPIPPNLRDAAVMPKASQNSRALAASAVMGPELNKPMRVAATMMQIEKLVESLSSDIPQARDIFAPVIMQMRDLGAAVLANEEQGGMGSIDHGTMAPPPMPPGAGVPMPGLPMAA